MSRSDQIVGLHLDDVGGSVTSATAESPSTSHRQQQHCQEQPESSIIDAEAPAEEEPYGFHMRICHAPPTIAATPEREPPPVSATPRQIGVQVQDHTGNSNTLFSYPTPLSHASLFSLLTYSWLIPLLSRGYRAPLTESDLPPLAMEDEPDVVTKQWQENMRQKWKEGGQGSPYDMCMAAYNSFGSWWMLSGLLALLSNISQLLQPWFIQKIIATFEQSGDDGEFIHASVEGYLWSCALILSTLLSSILLHYMVFLGVRTGNAWRTAVSKAIYEKLLKLSRTSRTSQSIGTTVNLFSNDTQRLFDSILVSHFVWLSPLTILVALGLMIHEIGISAIAGVGLLILLAPFQTFLTKSQATNRRSQCSFADARIKLLTEMMNGIRVVKTLGWEDALERMLSSYRSLELRYLSSNLTLQGLNQIVSFATPVAVTSLILIIFSLTGGEITSTKVFGILSYVGLLRTPVLLLPVSLTGLTDGRVALERIGRFMSMEEVEEVKREPLREEETEVVKMVNASWRWKKVEEIETKQSKLEIGSSPITPSQSPSSSSFRIDDGGSPLSASLSSSSSSTPPTIASLSFTLPRGSLTAVIGAVGTGKSSLLAAIAGEMILDESMNDSTQPSPSNSVVKGRILYLPQDTWLLNSTVRENIILDIPFDSNRFDHALEAACLKHDLSLLPNGIETEIGEKGINLSGGQKSRICLARAFYRIPDTDLYLLDDPLSALDAQVGREVFRQGISSSEGLLKEKTRLVAMSSHLYLLKNFDRIIVMDNKEAIVDSEVPSERSDVMSGRIVAIGTFDELKDRYAGLMSQQKKTETPDGDSEEVGGFAHKSTNEHPKSSIEKKTSTTSISPSSATSPSSPTTTSTPLMTTEATTSGSVRSSIWLYYFGGVSLSAVGIAKMIGIISIFIITQGVRVLCDTWLSLWSVHSTTLGSNHNSDSFYIYVYLIMIGIMIGMGCIRSWFFQQSVALYASRTIHASVLKHLLTASIPNFFDVTPIGRILNRFSKDIDLLDTLLPYNMFLFLQDLCTLIGLIVVCSVATPFLLLLLLPIGICFYYLRAYFSSSQSELKRLESRARSPLISHFESTVNGLTLIRSYSLQSAFTQKCSQLLVEHSRAFLPLWWTQRWLALRLDLLGCVLVGSMAFFTVGLRDSISPGLAALGLVYSLQFTGMLQLMTRNGIDTENYLQSVERLLEMNEVKQEGQYHMNGDEKLLKEYPDVVSKVVVPLPSSILPVRSILTSSTSDCTPHIWPSTGSITFTSVSLRYRPSLPLVLRSISFFIPGGSRIGIVGRTGSGKSSLLQALFRLVEIEDDGIGRIEIDEIDTRSIGLSRLRSSLSIIPQESILFCGTLRENIDPFSQFTDADVTMALEQVHLSSMLTSLPLGLRSHVQEGGANFSQGQRQLISIARCLLKRTKILVLDEATSSMDAETDTLIQSTIRTNFQNCTVLTIAHRLETIIDSDQILMLEDGRVKEFGPPFTLLSDPSSGFRSLVTEGGGQDYLNRMITLAKEAALRSSKRV